MLSDLRTISPQTANTHVKILVYKPHQEAENNGLSNLEGIQ